MPLQAMRVVLFAASLTAAFSVETGRTGKSNTAITSNGELLRQQRMSSKQPVAPWGWSIGDSWEGIAFKGATAPKKSVPIKFCQIHREMRPIDTLCLYAGNSEQMTLKSFLDASEWGLEERQWNSHRPSNYSVRLIGPEFPEAGNEGQGGAGCEVNLNKQTCCLDSRLPVELGNKGRDTSCDPASTGGGGEPGNIDCYTTVMRQCEVFTTDGDTTMGWTFMSNRLAQRGDCLTRTDTAFLEEAYSVSVQPCVEDALSELGQRQVWHVHQKINPDSGWAIVDNQAGQSLEPASPAL